MPPVPRSRSGCAMLLSTQRQWRSSESFRGPRRGSGCRGADERLGPDVADMKPTGGRGHLQGKPRGSQRKSEARVDGLHTPVFQISADVLAGWDAGSHPTPSDVEEFLTQVAVELRGLGAADLRRWWYAADDRECLCWIYFSLPRTAAERALDDDLLDPGLSSLFE